MRTLPHREDSRWDFSSWVPDAVVIQLGANDFWNEHPGEELFRNTYRALVDDIRAHYPGAHIVCVLAPGLVDGKSKEFKAHRHARALVSDVLRGELDVFIAAWISRPPLGSATSVTS
ncbi:GDSL-type esterase/lipase family protein [Archangium gephyra]|uniref:GDSL-type esterase/lipase family protein n=1 Tax=Archangium gephyra TaxID=48 RepID=UPI0035D452CD